MQPEFDGAANYRRRKIARGNSAIWVDVRVLRVEELKVDSCRSSIRRWIGLVRRIPTPTNPGRIRERAMQKTLCNLTLVATASLAVFVGCSAGHRQFVSSRGESTAHPSAATFPAPAPPDVALVSHQESRDDEDRRTTQPATEVSFQALDDLETVARSSSPSLRRLAQEYQAAKAKVRYIDKLPDPTIAANIFAHPIETAAGSQRANLSFSQKLPWLSRLDAEQQQAFFAAAALGPVFAAESLRVVGDLRALWYRMYILQKQIDIIAANQQLLDSLIQVETSRIATAGASQRDVLFGTLEYARLAEQLVMLRQQMASTKAEVNRLIGRDAATPVSGPQHIEVALPNWNHALLRELAHSNQPEIEAARIRRQAARWGVEVARLKRRPDFTFSASWFAMDDNRPTSSIVDVGEDAWAVGAMMSIPTHARQYAAMEQEARWQHSATESTIEQIEQRYDTLLFDLWEQAVAASETAELYESTIIPQAQQTLRTDQEAYGNGSVEFERVVEDIRDVLASELGYHRAMARLATSLARIKQAVGTDPTADGAPAAMTGQ